jgi:hypothetical protein
MEKMGKKNKKNDPRVQPSKKKWSFLVICRCHIGFFYKKNNFDPTVRVVIY